jgi:hypothetical protein
MVWRTIMRESDAPTADRVNFERAEADEESAGHPSFERALIAARPTSPQLARQLRLRALLAGVLGVERPLPALDRFAIERQIGAGGMGVVYRGHELATRQPVAIKLLPPGAAYERARFEREARVLRELGHPGVVGYLDHGTTPDGHAYLVMEWVDGEDLAVRLRRGPLDVTAALRLGVAIARAMIAVHAAGVIHRDLKPSNVILAGGSVDDVRVIDFGVARTQAPGGRLTATGAVIGTPHYMAPEQIRGVADVRTDVYGLGATLFEAIAGRAVFVGDHPGAVMIAVLAEAPPSLGPLRADVPGAVDAAIGRMLAKDPADRPVDMAAVATELSQLVAELARGRDAAPVLSRAERAPTAERHAPRGAPGDVLGRERPLAQIAGILAEAANEERSELVVISGDPGIGRSSLLDAIALDAPDWLCLRARARRGETGLPFATLRTLLASEPTPLGETLSDLLAGRDRQTDPVVLGDRVLLAWLDRVERWTDRARVLVLLDDADLADHTSLRLLDRALAHLASRSFVVAVTQAGAARAALGAHVEGRVTRLTLTPLGARAVGQLAARWAPTASDPERARAVAIAAGNPSHLRALLPRGAVHEARSTAALAARSVAGLIWARLGALAPEVRRALRAASIVGRELWVGALATLLGVDPGDLALARWIDALIGEDYLRAAPASRISGQPQLEFTSELTYLAAYELSTEDDRRAGHRAIARWLADHAPGEDVLRAHHLDGAGARDEAARHHLLAARAALIGGDVGVLDACLARARVADAPPDVLGEATALHAQAAFWRGAIREALETADAALARLSPGTSGWFGAASLAITAAGQIGDHAAVWRIADAVVATAPRDDDARERRVIAACRALSQLAETTEQARPLEAVAQELTLDALGPEARAWRHRAAIATGARRGFDPAIATIVAAHQAHVEHRDLRSGALMGIFLCSYYVWSGGWERARAVIDDALRVARRLGVTYLELWGAYAEAKLLVETAPHAEAAAALDRVIAGSVGSPRIRAGAQVYAALAAARAGAHTLALAHATAARATHATPVITAAATAIEVRARLALGQLAEARALEAALAPHATATSRFVEFDEVIRLAWCELAIARGDDALTRAACTAAASLIRERALTLADPLRRNEYLVRPHLIARTLEVVAPFAPG